MDRNQIKEFMENPGYGPAPESAAKVQAWLDSYGRKFGHFINNGKHLATDISKFRQIICPADKSVLAEVADGTEKDVAAALDAAEDALYRWRQMHDITRSEILYAIGRCFQKNARSFAVLESLENGKPIRETRDIDGRLVERHFLYHASWAMRRKDFAGFHAGVIAQIVPWNFPLLMLAWKIAVALSMGNTVVLKPAQTTPLTALMFAEMLREEIDIPPGVINIVCGGVESGQALVREMARRARKNPKVYTGLKFTGSKRAGSWIRKETAGSGLHLTMELGGKGPFIVCEDADLYSAARGVIDGCLGFNQGHTCCAPTRLIIQESVNERFMRILKEEVSKLLTGHPLDKSIDIGAVNSKEQLDRIQSYLEIAKQEGATLWSPEGFVCTQNGYYCPPTIIEHVATTARVAQEEIFGPVVVAMTYRTPNEAIDLANNTRYGLAASVWTQDISKAGQIARDLEVGVVWINGTNRFDAASEFGGRKESGYGREGGREGILEVLTPTSLFGHVPYPVTHFKKEKEDTDLAYRPRVEATYRFLVNGALARPDGDSGFRVYQANKEFLANLPDANRKDVRNAVEFARLALPGWLKKTADDRARTIRYIKEKLQQQRERYAECIARETDWPLKAARLEVDAACRRLFYCAALAETFDGTIPPAGANTLTLSVKEPMGVMGIKVPDEFPLLGLVTTVGLALAMGNTVVALAGRHPYTAMEFVDVLQLSAIPSGVLNLLCTEHPDSVKPDSPLRTLAEHEEVRAMWHFGTAEASTMVEEASAYNMKRTFVSYGKPVNWQSDEYLEYLCHQATAEKSLWFPYGT